MTSSRVTTRSLSCLVGIGALSLGLAATATAGDPRPHTAEAAGWKRNAVVATGNQLSGPFLAQSKSGKFFAEYTVQSGDGSNSKTRLIWSRLHGGKWSRQVTAANNVFPPRGLQPSFAVSDARVATFSAANTTGPRAPKLNLTEQTLAGRRAFTRTLARGFAVTVALDSHNTAMAVYTGMAHDNSTIYARTVSSSGRVGKPIALQRPTSRLDAPVVVSTGAGRFVAAWLAAGGTTGDVETDIVHAATFSDGKWHKATTPKPKDKSVLYLGLTARGSNALLTYTDELRNDDTETHAMNYRSGTWTSSQTIAKNTGTGPWTASLSTTGQAELTNDRAYLRAPGSNTWRAGPLVPTFSEYCGGSFDPSAYQGKTLHWFVITPAAGSVSKCRLTDYVLK